MPTREQHKKNASHNNDLSNEAIFRDNRNYDDWKVIIIFYNAVHLIEAYFGKDDKHAGNHETREKMIDADVQLKEVRAPYGDLYRLSKKARYKCLPISSADLRAADEDIRNIQQILRPFLM